MTLFSHEQTQGNITSGGIPVHCVPRGSLSLYKNQKQTDKY